MTDQQLWRDAPDKTKINWLQEKIKKLEQRVAELEQGVDISPKRFDEPEPIITDDLIHGVYG